MVGCVALNPLSSTFCSFTPPGDLKTEDPSKEAGDEKAEEDNDYHRSDEQVKFILKKFVCNIHTVVYCEEWQYFIPNICQMPRRFLCSYAFMYTDSYNVEFVFFSSSRRFLIM